MRASSVLSLLSAAGLAAAARPTNTSICDYYTTAVLMNNTAANQYGLVQALVNTVVIGNYTKPNVGIMVPGILAKGTFNGTAVNLLPYFDGMLASSNRGGSSGVAVNFLDGGAATPILAGMPANSTSSNQYKLLTHLYQYFGYLLGCTEYGVGAFPAYAGHASMASVHQFMDLDAYEVGYFIEQVGLAAASFGVAESDIVGVADALNALFGYKCAPAVTVIPAQGPQYESICIAADCPTAANATCSSYITAMEPAMANATNMYMSNSTTGSNSTAASSATPTSSGLAMQTANAGSHLGVEALVGFVGFAALAAAL